MPEYHYWEARGACTLGRRFVRSCENSGFGQKIRMGSRKSGGKVEAKKMAGTSTTTQSKVRKLKKEE